MLVEGPPRAGEIPFRDGDDTYCTETVGAPIADTVAAGVVPLLLLASMYSLGGRDVGETEVKVKLAAALVSGGVEATSAVWGFYTVGKCRRYGDRLRRGQRAAWVPEQVNAAALDRSSRPLGE